MSDVSNAPFETIDEMLKSVPRISSLESTQIDQIVKAFLYRLPYDEAIWVAAIDRLSAANDLKVTFETYARAMVQFSNSFLIPFKFGIFLHHTDDLLGAARTFEALRHRFPDHPEVAPPLCSIYAHWGRTDEALQILKHTHSKFPDRAVVVGQLARLYEQLGQCSDASWAYAEACRLAPTSSLYRRWAITDSRLSGNTERAEELACGFVGADSEAPEFVRIAGDMAAVNGSLAVAASRYLSSLEHYLNDLEFILTFIKTLLLDGKVSDCLGILGRIDQSLTSNPTICDLNYLCRLFARDFSGARAIAAEISVTQQKLKRMYEVRMYFVTTLLETPEIFWGHLAADDGDSVFAGLRPGQTAGERPIFVPQMTLDEMGRHCQSSFGTTLEELALSFESVGENCTFGLIQRAIGVEPIGLLRYAGLTYHELMDGLSSRFEGLDDPAKLSAQGDSGDWDIYHERYGLRYHTMMSVTSIDERTLIKKQSRYLRFTRSKFFEDLAEGHKIYVYTSWAVLSRTQVRNLFNALKLCGAKYLLYVVEGFPIGSVTIVEPGILLGRIDILSRQEPNVARDVSCWVTLMAKARELCKRLG